MSDRNKLIAALALCLGLLTVLGIGLTVVALDGDQNVSAAPATAPTAPSTSDDWQRAVCRPGSFYNGANILRNSTGSAMCMSVDGNRSIGIATYASSFALENDLALRGSGLYAETTTAGGEIYVFVPLAPSSASRKDLSPLEEFGFEIRQIPRSS